MLLDLLAGRAELPPLVHHLAIPDQPYHYRQYLLVHIHASDWIHCPLLDRRCRGPVSLSVTLASSPGAVTGTSHSSIRPRSQIIHSYGFAVSSVYDDLDCRADAPIFI